jgi:lantibiotic modifying enzyme
MGIMLFFAHYGRFTGNTIYTDFAGELLDEIYEDIRSDTPIDFENGLCGIGWAIEYLLQNAFMEGDSDEILFEIDKKIMACDIRRIDDASFRTGLGGISCYIQKRINSPCRSRQKKPFDEIYLKDWESITHNTIEWNDSQILFSIVETLPSGDDIPSWKLGLENGCAGAGLIYCLNFDIAN